MNKKLFLSAVACVCTGFLFTGCDKDDDNGSETGAISGIQAKVENGNDYNSEIDVVKAWVDYWEYEVATGRYANDGFTLNLPETLDAEYLRPLSEMIVRGDVKVSDADAKIAEIRILAYKSRVNVGVFDYCNWNYYEYKRGEEIVTEFIYSDRNVSVTGIEKDETGTETYNVSLKKGWNKTYVTLKEKTWEWTSKEPSGLKWYFKEYYSYNKSPYNSTRVPAKTVGKQKLFSSLRIR